MGAGLPDQSHEGIHDTQTSPQTVLSPFSGEKTPSFLPFSATTGRDTVGLEREEPAREPAERPGPVPKGLSPGDSSPSDAELVRRACRGEHWAWEAIVDRHLPVVNAVARSYRLSAPDREDAVQTVWLILNQHLPRLHSPELLRAWLRRVAHDTCGRQRHRSARYQLTAPHSLAQLPFAGTPGPETEYLRRERHEELHRAIRRLTDPGERRAALRYLDGSSEPPASSDRSGRRSADGPENPRTAVNQRRRMLRRLRRLLEEPT